MSTEALSLPVTAIESSVDRQPIYMQQHRLQSGEAVTLSFNHAMAGAREIEQEIGLEGSLVAGIHAGGKEFAVLDMRGSSTTNVPALLIDETFSLSDIQQSNFKGLRSGEKIIIGRDCYDDRFDYPQTVSRKHFSVLYDAASSQLYVEDLDSANGTMVTGFITSEISKEDLIRSEYTRDLQTFALGALARRYGERDDSAPYGYFENHPIIGRQSRSVRNGVFGTSASEMVLVDDKSNIMRLVTNDFMSSLGSDRAERLSKTLSVDSLLKSVEYHTARVLTYDLVATEKLSQPHFAENSIINLSEYIDKGVGVCRHQALLAAHLIEAAIDNGLLNGSVGVERNYDAQIGGGHAWAVYRSASGGDEIIVDPAQHFVGTRDKAQREGRWKYQLSAVTR